MMIYTSAKKQTNATWDLHALLNGLTKTDIVLVAVVFVSSSMDAELSRAVTMEALVSARDLEAKVTLVFDAESSDLTNARTAGPENSWSSTKRPSC